MVRESGVRELRVGWGGVGELVRVEGEEDAGGACAERRRVLRGAAGARVSLYIYIYI